MSYTGFTRINGTTIPYAINDGQMKLFTGIFPADIPDNTNEILGEYEDGVLGKCNLYVLSVPINNTECVFEKDGTPQRISNSNKTVDVQLQIENYSSETEYYELFFNSPELNHFFASSRICQISEDEIIISRNPLEVKKSRIYYRNTEIEILIRSAAYAHVETMGTASSETKTELVVTFPKTRDKAYILGLYRGIKAFFSFIYNRQNVAIHHAILRGVYLQNRGGKLPPTHCYAKSDLIPFEKFIQEDEDGRVTSKTPLYGNYASHFSELLQMFFPVGTDENDTIGAIGIHPSAKYRYLLDLRQSLHITSSFEYYVRRFLPEMASESELKFCDEIRALLDDYISSHSGKLKKKAKDMKKGIQPKLSLSDKINKVWKGYEGWSPVEPILNDDFGRDLDELADAANEWRNELAHEKREYEPNIKTVKAIRLVEHLNYTIILRTAGYSDEEIKVILNNCLIK